MKIDVIELYHIAMPFIYPFRTAYGNDTGMESVVVRMASGDVYGWGETCALSAPRYSGEWAGGTFLALRDWLAPQVIRQDVASGQQLQSLMAGFKGNCYAKAGLDLAWWDMEAHRQGRPLWQLLGGQSPSVAVGADLGVLDSFDMLREEVAKVVAAGFKRLKLKFRPGWDVPMVAVVRDIVPDLPIHIDCNSGFTLNDVSIFRELDSYNLSMIEQPLAHDDLLDHARLQAAIKTPICLDESITSVSKVRKAAAVGACRWINIKAGRLGGLTNAVAVHNACQEAGIPCWVGGMGESNLGQAASLALATLSNVHYPCDIFPSKRFFDPDLAEPELTLSGPSEMRAPDGPGVGYEPTPERLMRFLVQSAVIR